LPEGYLGQKSNVTVKTSEVVKRATLKLLYVIVVPMALLSLFVHVISGVTRRIRAIFVKSKPDVSLPVVEVRMVTVSFNSLSYCWLQSGYRNLGCELPTAR